MNKILKKILIFTLLIILFLTARVNANVTSTDPTTTSGGEVTITLRSSETVYAYKVNLADAGGLTFKSVTSSAGQTNGTTVNGASASGVTTLATYTFKVPEVTAQKKYSVKFSVSVSTDGETFNSSTNTSTVTVNPQAAQPTTPSTPTPSTPTQSGDATLKSITVGDKTYSGSSLNSTITQTVGANVASIKISATKNNSKATVSGTGTKSLVAGQTNKFSITVTAENGTKKTYNVNVIRLAEESMIPNVIDEGLPGLEEGKLMLTSLVIKDVDLDPEFKPETYTYIANVQNMKELEIDATASNPEAEINIEGATDLQEGDNIIKITVTLGDEIAEYIIDVYNTLSDEIMGTTEDESNDNNILSDLKQPLLIGLICLLGLISIGYMIFSYKLSKEIEELTADEIILDDDDEDDNFKVKNQNIVTKTGKIGRHF